MRESRPALLAYYYFDFKDIAKRDIRGLLTSLLLQLVDKSDCCWDLLLDYTRDAEMAQNSLVTQLSHNV